MTASTASHRIGLLAARAGVSADTIRHYERLGLLPRAPRDASGYRSFPPSAVERVVLIQRALDAGFSLADLKRVLAVRDAGGAPCHEVYGIAQRRLRDLDERIAGLRVLQRELREALRRWKARLDATPDGVRAGLLDSWAAARNAGARRRPGGAVRTLAPAADRPPGPPRRRGQTRG
jgi:DNA-binding transcriptional MerR regulator